MADNENDPFNFPDDMPEELKDAIRKGLEGLRGADGIVPVEGGIAIPVPTDGGNIPQALRALLGGVDEITDTYWGTAPVNLDIDKASMEKAFQDVMQPGIHVVEIEGPGNIKVGTIMNEAETLANGYTDGDFHELWEQGQRPVEYFHPGCHGEHHGWLTAHDLYEVDEEVFKKLSLWVQFSDDTKMPEELWEVRHKQTERQLEHLMPGSDQPYPCAECGKHSTLLFRQHVLTSAGGPMLKPDGTIVIINSKEIEPLMMSPDEMSPEFVKNSYVRNVIVRCMQCGHVEDINPDRVRVGQK